MKLCADCMSGVILPGTPKGQMVTLDRFSAYLASPPASSRLSVAANRAVVLFTDVFELPLGNPKIMADAFSSELGVDVWVPDMFNGHPPLKNEDIMRYDHQDPGSPMPSWKLLGFLSQTTFVFPKMIMGENKQSRVYTRMKEFVETLNKDRGIEKIGAVGYCYGGSVLLSLVPFHLLSSAVIAHPGDFDHKLVEDIDFPTSWITCQEDFVFGPDKQEDVQRRFSLRSQRAKEGRPEQVPRYEFRRYMGTRHGFGCRPALDIPMIKDAFVMASEQTTAWFKDTLL
ncbi:hypothetical protein DACRYDRAFT_117492 [Dacryopinax primogenitus]|uniref:Dienelactone hydrolase domain-containing protein n=1 Tax=Dacryopinax primogenitus (strain DJM 731) TaxID=1858805 RepID=M5FUF5_DACPD|nr:uncharacterized protein DACRYDRAFT_117492 [Dacryopinax primogenitus]EJT99858.1 hypothetical protein DACRYDRAFT_117492 [Dacryopinax primogenitus]